MCFYKYITLIIATNWRVIDLYYKDVVPKSVGVFEQSSVTFYCGSSSPVGWSYKSYFSSLDRHQPILQKHLVGSKQIALNDLNEEDSGLYYCNGTYADGYFLSHFEVKVYKTFIPFGNVVPDWIEIVAGGNLTLTCMSNLNVEWFSKYFSDQDKFIWGNSLNLFNLQKKHSGVYACRGFKNDNLGGDLKPRVFHSQAIIIVVGIINRIEVARNY